ncbi:MULTISPECIES: hypothetical protein [unclassified Nocardia]|uniref:hypothetical protein n=1 Tax=unclassified Nocardia TaxID=2637762 RepID=UPI00278C260F|nr:MULTISPECIES: hypothetical protein [unclassified Nocardia]
MIYVVIGPPAAGKSTWCRQRAHDDDVIIDFDRLACALSPRTEDGHDHPPTVTAVTKAARQAAIDRAFALTGCDVYLIHSTPSPALLARYRARGAEVVVIDPGREVVMERVKRERPWRMQQVVKQWYEQGPPAAADRVGSGQPDRGHRPPVTPPERSRTGPVANALTW